MSHISRTYSAKLVTLLLVMLLLCTSTTKAQSTAFSYQGKLTDAGNPANGNYDLQFKLFDALTVGTQIGMTNLSNNVPVSGGIFSVTLDFGVAAFPGANRFLEIGVRPVGGGAFTTLTPRQPITKTPYSIRSLSAANADVAVTAASADSLSAACIGCVTTAKLADSNVTNVKIVDVAGGKVTGALTNATIPGANVTGAVTSATNAVNAANATNATTALNFSGAVGGDVTGNQTATTVEKLRNVNLPAPVAADNGKVLRYKNNGVDPISLEWAAVAAGGVTSVTASGPLASSGGTTPNISLAGVIAAANGGTGLSTTGAVGNLLRSNGTTWTSSALQVTDVPDLGATYIKNSTTLQASSNFNIGGNGTVGGTVSANTVNATTQYNVSGARILSNPGLANLFVGVNAGQSNTTGGGNNFFGEGAGFSNTTGVANNFFGFNAGSNNTTGSGNTFFGGSAGQSNTTGGVNAFFGNRAGFNNTTGLGNTFFGPGAGEDNTTGSHNAFFGNNAGQHNTTADANAFFGLAAGKFNTTGAENAFFGAGAGEFNTTGGFNAFFGAAAGEFNSTGFSNSFFGYVAGLNNTTGFSNTFVGSNAGSFNTTGQLNSFFGASAGNSNTTGSNNAFFGNNAGQANTMGDSNVFFGQAAGQSNTTGSFNNFFGFFAGVSNTTGSRNTYIGYFANGANGITNAIALGANAYVTQSNSLVLGSINGTNSATADTSVGIGTTAPKAKLDVTGGNILVGSPGQGIILKSPDGTKCSKLSIDNAGTLSVVLLPSCP